METVLNPVSPDDWEDFRTEEEAREFARAQFLKYVRAGRIFILILFFLPALCFAQRVDEPDDIAVTLHQAAPTKEEAKTFMGTASLILSVPLFLLASQRTYEGGKGVFIAAGSICVIHGAICLIKF